MTVLILVVALTIFISAQCSLYESTLYSTRMGTLEAAKLEPRKRGLAKRMIFLKRKISEPIAAILILNTVANTAGATIAGIYAHKALGASWVPLFSIGFTLAILLISEIAPKTIGAVYWKTLWPFIVWPLSIMKNALYPFVKGIQKISDITTGGKSTPAITEQDILGVVRLGAKEGEISKWESLLVHNIINLENKTVEEIMTPRTVMFCLDEELTAEKAIELALKTQFSRIPVYRDDKENITGYVTIREMAALACGKSPETRLKEFMKPMAMTPHTSNCFQLLNDFLKKRRHMAIVTDKYGGVDGLVTLEDLLETLLGKEIMDEADKVEDMQELAITRRRAKAKHGEGNSDS